MKKSVITFIATTVSSILMGVSPPAQPKGVSPAVVTPGPALAPTPTPSATPAPVTVILGNVVRNPLFVPVGSDGQRLFAPWWLQIQSGAAATPRADTSAAVPGTTAARVDIARTNGHDWGVQLEQHIPTAVGTYAISFWARASSLRPLPVALQQATAPYTPYSISDVNLTTTWQPYTLRYNATITDDDTFFAFNLGGGVGSVWLGDVTVTDVNAAGQPLPTPTPVPTSYVRGLNLDGGMRRGAQDAFASPAMLDWARSRGFNIFRVPFTWAHLQPALGGPFDNAYLGTMDRLVAAARSRGLRIAFVPMDRREAPVADFISLWTRLAWHYRHEPAIWGYDLMNEPDRDAWNTAYLPRIIAAVRSVDMTHTILVESSTGGWGQRWVSHTVGLPVRDPANNVLYEAHFYFDTPANGRYLRGGAFDVPKDDLNIGVERVADFVNWCNANSVRCYVGEFGIPGGWTGGNRDCTNGAPATDPRWLTVLDRFLTYLDRNHISSAYWEAGPFGDVNDLGPTCSGRDRPQLAILQRHPGNRSFNAQP